MWVLLVGKVKMCGKMGVGQRKGRLWVKKIPTLYVREYGPRTGQVRTLMRVTKGCEWVRFGEGWATEKVDGACCAIIRGRLWKRVDVREGQHPPKGSIPCTREPDSQTGSWPHWVVVDSSKAEDRWYWSAFVNTPWAKEDGTYEAVGPHFKGNPYGLDEDYLEKHGRIKIEDCPRTFDGIRTYLLTHDIEGIVFYRGNGQMCKIKRTDFGYEWPVEREEDGEQ